MIKSCEYDFYVLRVRLRLSPPPLQPSPAAWFLRLPLKKWGVIERFLMLITSNSQEGIIFDKERLNSNSIELIYYLRYRKAVFHCCGEELFEM